MANEKFCLRWNDFESNISVAFRELRDDKDFFDVTIACDDEQLQAHKVILSACSPFFRNILKRNPHQHPLLYLKGVKYTDLQAVLNFMYHGEVNVAQEELNSFLSVAEDLRVKGLTQNKQGGGSEIKTSTKREGISSSNNSKPQLPIVTPPPPVSPREPPVKRPRPPPVPDYDDDDIQEVVPIKSEPVVASSVVQQQQPELVYQEPPQEQQNTLATYQEDDVGQYEEDYGQYETTGEQDYGDQSFTDSNKGDSYAELLESCLRTKVSKDPVTSGYVCNLCSKVCCDLSSARFHLESRHFPNPEGYTCPVCGKFCKTKNALACHKVKCRRSTSIQFGIL